MQVAAEESTPLVLAICEPHQPKTIKQTSWTRGAHLLEWLTQYSQI